MIYRLLCLLASFVIVFNLVPVRADNSKPFLAVFSSIEFPDEDWEKYHPDITLHTTGWQQFDEFLDVTKKAAGDRDILLDIQVHGNHILAIYNGNSSGHYYYNTATVGYLVNHIEQHLKGSKITVCLESCFGADCYKNSIRNNDPKKLPPGTCCENCDHIPTFPIYGICEKYSNLNNLVFLQYIHGLRFMIGDLREYEYRDHLEVRDEDRGSQDNQMLYTLLIILRSYAI